MSAAAPQPRPSTSTAPPIAADVAKQSTQRSRVLELFFPIVIFIIDITRTLYSLKPEFRMDIDFHCYRQILHQWVLHGETRYGYFTCDFGRAFYPGGYMHIYRFIWFLVTLGWTQPTREQATSLALDTSLAAVQEDAVFSDLEIRRVQYIHAVVSLLINTIAIRTLAMDYMSGWRRFVFYLLVTIMTQTVYRIGISLVANDVFTTLFVVVLFAAIKSQRYWLSTLCFAFAVAFKMNAVLWGPPMLLVYLHSIGFYKSALHFLLAGLFQIPLGLPFLLSDWKSYLRIAYNLSRDFNNQTNAAWTFLGDVARRSQPFYTLLFVCTFLFLIMFLWIAHLVFRRFAQCQQQLPASALTEWKLFVLAAGYFVTFLFVRGLHPQFSIWVTFFLPYLMYTVMLRKPSQMLHTPGANEQGSAFKWFCMICLYFLLDWCFANAGNAIITTKAFEALQCFLHLDLDCVSSPTGLFGKAFPKGFALSPDRFYKLVANGTFDSETPFYRQIGLVFPQPYSWQLIPASLVLFSVCSFLVVRIFVFSAGVLRELRRTTST